MYIRRLFTCILKQSLLGKVYIQEKQETDASIRVVKKSVWPCDLSKISSVINVEFRSETSF